MPDTGTLLAELRDMRDRLTALIDDVSGESRKVKAALPEEIAKRDAAGLCIQCGEKPQITRGCCDADYQRTRRMMKRTGMSDAEAVKRHLLKADAPKGRPLKYPDPIPEGAAMAVQIEGGEGSTLPTKQRPRRKSRRK